jgi:hypothetical protein
LWKDRRPTLAEGRLVAAWTIPHVSQTTFGGVGGPIQLASLAVVDGSPKVDLADPAEHDGFIEEAETALRDHFRKQTGTGSSSSRRANRSLESGHCRPRRDQHRLPWRRRYPEPLRRHERIAHELRPPLPFGDVAQRQQ